MGFVMNFASMGEFILNHFTQGVANWRNFLDGGNGILFKVLAVGYLVFGIWTFIRSLDIPENHDKEGDFFPYYRFWGYSLMCLVLIITGIFGFWWDCGPFAIFAYALGITIQLDQKNRLIKIWELEVEITNEFHLLLQIVDTHDLPFKLSFSSEDTDDMKAYYEARRSLYILCVGAVPKFGITRVFKILDKFSEISQRAHSEQSTLRAELGATDWLEKERRLEAISKKT